MSHRSFILLIRLTELTGISVPKMYNTGTINPLQYAQQQRKRKLLWSKTNDNVKRLISYMNRENGGNSSYFRHQQVKSVQQ